MKLKLAYFGTPDFSAHLLEKLINDKSLPIEVTFVITQPDKRVGKKQILTPSPVKLMAQKYGIELHSAERLPGGSRTDSPGELQTKLTDLLKDCDLGLLCALGAIIPAELLQAPKYGIWNIHYSCLPYYRGPSPTAFNLIFNENKTGVTIFKMDEKIDHGPIIMQKNLKIQKSEKRPDLIVRQTNLAFEMFTEIVKSHEDFSQIRLSPQDESKATYTRRLSKQDGYIPLSALEKCLANEPLTQDELPTILKESKKFENCKLKIENSSEIIFSYFRGLFPWPGIWTTVELPRLRSEAGKPSQLNEKRLKLTNIDLIDNKLVIKRIQLEGKNEVDFNTFNNAYKVF